MLLLPLVGSLLLLPLMGIRSVMGERLLDRMWDWWGSGQMIAHGTETMLIGNVVDTDLVAMLIHVRIVTLLHHRLILLASVLHDSLGALFNSISALVFELEVSVFVHLLFRLHNRDVFDVVVVVIVTAVRCSHRGACYQNGTNGNEL